MERSSSEVESSSAYQEIPRLSRNLNAHYRVHKTSPLYPVLSQFIPLHNLTPYLFKIIL